MTQEIVWPEGKNRASEEDLLSAAHSHPGATTGQCDLLGQMAFRYQFCGHHFGEIICKENQELYTTFTISYFRWKK